MKGLKCLLRQRINIVLSVLILVLATSCGKGNDNPSGLAAIKLTFHDSSPNNNVVKINITVLETQIIDIYDNKTVISSQSHSFDLLELTKNNPVVLADTMVPAGTYKQIRLILDANSTVSLADGTTHPLSVSSGEQTGIKIDGVFTIPAGRLYTLDIDLDPNKSIHFTSGNGYMLKPVISLTGSDVNSGNFFYQGSANNGPFVLKLNPDGTSEGITSKYPKYIIKGNYFYDGLNQKISISPTEIDCPSCSFFENLAIDLFGDVPASTTYNVLTFGADYIDLKDSGTGNIYNLVRTPNFSLSYVQPTKDFTISTAVSNSLWANKTMVAQIIPEDGEGHGYAAVATISQDLSVNLDFSIPTSEFGGLSRNYLLVMAIVNNRSDVTLSTDGSVNSVKNLVANNSNNAIRLTISRDTLVPLPVSVPFVTNL